MWTQKRPLYGVGAGVGPRSGRSLKRRQRAATSSGRRSAMAFRRSRFIDGATAFPNGWNLRGLLRCRSLIHRRHFQHRCRMWITRRSVRHPALPPSALRSRWCRPEVLRFVCLPGPRRSSWWRLLAGYREAGDDPGSERGPGVAGDGPYRYEDGLRGSCIAGAGGPGRRRRSCGAIPTAATCSYSGAGAAIW